MYILHARGLPSVYTVRRTGKVFITAAPEPFCLFEFHWFAFSLARSIDSEEKSLVDDLMIYDYAHGIT